MRKFKIKTQKEKREYGKHKTNDIWSYIWYEMIHEALIYYYIIIKLIIANKRKQMILSLVFTYT